MSTFNSKEFLGEEVTRARLMKMNKPNLLALMDFCEVEVSHDFRKPELVKILLGWLGVWDGEVEAARASKVHEEERARKAKAFEEEEARALKLHEEKIKAHEENIRACREERTRLESRMEATRKRTEQLDLQGGEIGQKGDVFAAVSPTTVVALTQPSDRLVEKVCNAGETVDLADTFFAEMEEFCGGEESVGEVIEERLMMWDGIWVGYVKSENVVPTVGLLVSEVWERSSVVTGDELGCAPMDEAVVSVVVGKEIDVCETFFPLVESVSDVMGLSICPRGEAGRTEHAVCNGDAQDMGEAAGDCASELGSEMGGCCDGAVGRPDESELFCQVASGVVNMKFLWKLKQMPFVNPFIVTVSVVVFVQSWRVMSSAWSCLRVGRLFQPGGWKCSEILWWVIAVT